MTGISGTNGRAALEMLGRALTECRREGITGTLRMSGNPGATFHMRQGSIIAVDTPGAPGPDAILLRSGRISEEDWSATLLAAAQARPPQVELVARGGVGAAELQVLCLMAVQDAAFATVAGTLDGYTLREDVAEVMLPATHGIDPDPLLRETTRRLDALGRMPVRVLPHRERVIPAPGVDLRAHPLTDARREILGHADGRRCARDIAFRASRSVYSVTVEISRMLQEGLVEIVSGAHRNAASETPAPPGLVPWREPAPQPDKTRVVAGSDGRAPEPLPRRDPGSSGIQEALAKGKTPGRHGLPRLFARIRHSPPQSPTDAASPGDPGKQKGN